MTGMLGVIMAANGLNDYGVCPFSAVEDKLLSCMAKGRIPQNAKSVITVLFPYKTSHNTQPAANIDDYYEIAGQMLDSSSSALEKAFQGYSFVWFVNNSPIPDVFAASYSGLGVIGDNQLLINCRYGSYCFIGTIVTDLDMPATGSGVSRCTHCGKCILACPGSALSVDGFDGKSCISEISQQEGCLHSDQTKFPRSNGSAWVCNVCRDVCPMNVGVADTYINPFLTSKRTESALSDIGKLNNGAKLYKGPEVIKKNIKALDEQ